MIKLTEITQTKLKIMRALIVLLFSLFSINSFAQKDCTPIAETAFNTEIKIVKAHDFDEAKKEAITNLINSKCLTSKQVKMLLKTLSFEEDKLEIAKTAFAKVADPGNFAIVKDVFDFDDSKKALVEFMKK